MATVLLPKHRRTLYTRAVISRDLRHFINGRPRIWRSLDTTDKGLATIRATEWSAKTKRLFRLLRLEGTRMDKGCH